MKVTRQWCGLLPNYFGHLTDQNWTNAHLPCHCACIGIICCAIQIKIYLLMYGDLQLLSLLHRYDEQNSCRKNNANVMNKFTKKQVSNSKTDPTWAITQPNRSGLWLAHAATNRPPLLPPFIIILHNTTIRAGLITILQANVSCFQWLNYFPRGVESLIC